MKCERCNKKANAWRFSWFNLDRLCSECYELESKHPDYQRARDMEHLEVVAGNLNYKGIGLPENYKEWAEQYKQSSTK